MNSLPSEIRKHFYIVLIFACIVHFLTSVFSIGFHHGDEHFQVLEFAGLKLGLNTTHDLAWEYAARMRPALQPLICYFVVKSLAFFSLTDPFFHAIILRLISALLSITATIFLVKSFIPDIKSGTLQKWFITLSFLLWFLPYLNVRFSSEAWSGSLFVIAIAILHSCDKEKNTERKKIFIAGSLLGLAIDVRFQSAFFAIGIFLWMFFRKTGTNSLFSFVAGIAGMLLTGFLADAWFYGAPVFTPQNYFMNNILLDKASDYGVSPWWIYIPKIINGALVPFGLIIVASVIYLWLKFPKSILTLPVLLFVIVHCIIGHKELRFLFPLAKLCPLIFILSFDHLLFVTGKQHWLKEKPVTWIKGISGTINFFPLIILCFKPADNNTPVIRFVNKNYINREVVIMYDDQNPFYHFGLPFNFYNRSKTVFQKTALPGKNEIDSITSESKLPVLFITKRHDLGDDFRAGTFLFSKVFQTVPQQLNSVNYNHWLDRTEFFCIYKLAE